MFCPFFVLPMAGQCASEMASAANTNMFDVPSTFSCMLQGAKKASRGQVSAVHCCCKQSAHSLTTLQLPNDIDGERKRDSVCDYRMPAT